PSYRCSSLTTTLFLLLVIPRPPTPPLFPYTTLFRSARGALAPGTTATRAPSSAVLELDRVTKVYPGSPPLRALAGVSLTVTAGRSEEHTSELQSQSNLVCRLLLEKKKDATRQSAPCR